MDKINQHLLQRKRKKAQYLLNKKLRVKRQFRDKKEQYMADLSKNIPQNQGNSRKIDFYNNVFSKDSEIQPTQPPIQNKRQIRKQKHQQMMRKLQQQKQEARQVKHNKKKLIKKMNNQRTKRGQPIMKNYIDYALFKLQQDIKKEKANQ